MRYYQLSIDPELGCAFARHDKEIKLADIKQLMEEIAEQTGEALVEKLLIDTRKCQFLLSESDIYEAALYTKSVLMPDREARFAMIVQGSLAHALARMFSIYSEWDNYEFEIFSTTKEAKIWLSIPDTYNIEILGIRE